MSNKVFVVKCASYDQAEEKLKELLDLMQGIESFVSAGEKIVLKANLLLPAKPEKAVTTHPAIVGAIGRMVKDAGAIAILADSPGSGFKYNEKMLKRIYRTCGLKETCEAAGIKLNFDTSAEEVSYPEGKLIKRFEVITPILQSDGVLNLCKLKTHLFMHMTGAVKNSFGAIPGLAKPGYHAKLKDPERFANMLIDLSNFVAPRLSIMDAVVAMEGEGPNAGDPRHVGLILASTNPLAIDVVAGEIIGIDRQKNSVLIEAAKRGLGPTRLEEVDLVGVEKSELRIPDFKLPATICGETGFAGLPWFQRLLVPFFKDGMSVKPRIDKEKCIACGSCYEACPMDAITLYEKEYSEIDDEKCVRCYCCHEMCQYDAVFLHKSLLYRFVNR
ncbi:MAG: DUF362 domain-containing protein [Deltaproteobacteria bacterium]|nr:DUF362 domain-containing protein [Deltaproteobacteria bacterium]